MGRAVLLARGEKRPSLRRCGAGIGPALRGRAVGTFPGDAEWEQGGGS